MTATYTGDVAVGGPAQTREASGLRITKVAVGPFNNNCYLLENISTGDLVLVDAANEAPTLLALIGDRPLSGIVTTHQHGDHWQALEELKQATGAATYAHPDDAPGLPIQPDHLVPDGGTIPVGDIDLEAIHLVGHTPGSIALLHASGSDQPHLITGDCLFPGGVGNTNKDPVAFESLINDVEAKLFNRLPDATWVYPGHGSDTTLGAERPQLAEWRQRGW